MKTIDPLSIKPRGDIVIVRRVKPVTEFVEDHSSNSKRAARIAYEAHEGSALVIPSISSDVTRAVVLAAGPDSDIPVGFIVGVPGHKQDSPVMRDHDASGEWEAWHQDQLHYVAEWV